ncbi:MAG TPA: orotidine-5'-phosphate decarboxylase [Gemmatimonadaceae bacterium]|nr:orotidine-5'-phosphate decarboxylase [Gemmatimonadaceae bacterium]
MTTPIVALDVPGRAQALAIVDELHGLCGFYKVGLQLYTAEGPGMVAALRERGAEVFLDLKWHDIPNTVRGAAASAAALGVRLVTVHASGGLAMLRAAQEAAGAGCGVLAVTVLTSLDASALAEAWGREARGVELTAEVVRLAGLASEAGLHGVVCSGHEAAAVSARYAGLATLVPGIRLAGSGVQDQARVMTPARAAAAGARYIVVGRTVTADGDPRGAMERVLAEVRAAGAAGGV